MDSEFIAGVILLVIGVVAFVLLVAAEAGVIAAVRERALREPAESRMDALRRFYRERQLTLSTLALARNLAIVSISSVAAFLVVDEIGHNLAALGATIGGTVLALMILQSISRLVVARQPERWRRSLKPVVSLIRTLFRGPVRILEAPVAIALRLLRRGEAGEEPGEVEEHILLTELNEAGAALQEEERQMIRGVMEMEFTTVREVMVPRTDIVAAALSDGFERVSEILVKDGHSRIPVYEENMDNIVGIAFAKDVLKHLARGGRRPNMRDIIRTAHFVPESKKVHEMLAEMKHRQLSIAIVIDEYGGTAGLVTIEDLLEEIVGEIRDEFDIQEQQVQLLTANEAIVDARVGIDELNEMFDVAIQKSDFDSIGGFIINELGRIPSVGDQVKVDGISLKVLSVSGRRIKKVRVTKLVPAPEEENARAAS